MKIILISGSLPPESCGIGDYTIKLAASLGELGVDVFTIGNINWSFTMTHYKKVSSSIARLNPTIVHIQYPSKGYGYSLLPQILSLTYKTVVTIHEVSQASFLRKLSLFFFSFRAYLVFTNQFEMLSFRKLFPWVCSMRCRVIPIGSNISSAKSSRIVTPARGWNTIVYFGQIRAQKGLEEVISLAVLISKAKLKYRVKILGQVMDSAYCDKLVAESRGLPIDWVINQSEEGIAEILSQCNIGFLPFPDGVSERRGSLLAMLTHKMLVFTTKGRHTTQDLERCTYLVSSALDVIEILSSLSFEGLINLYHNKSEESASYLYSRCWDVIAQKHFELYQTNDK